METGPAARRLIEWYDAHARAMPWRIPPGETRRADPYHVWLSEVMLQQTTVVTVGPYFADFVARWPTVHDLADAPSEAVMAAWAGLGYYARARNLHRCAITVSRAHGGQFPNDHAGLLALPGIGPYTSAAISATAARTSRARWLISSRLPMQSKFLQKSIPTHGKVVLNTDF